MTLEGILCIKKTSFPLIGLKAYYFGIVGLFLTSNQWLFFLSATSFCYGIYMQED